MRRRSLIVPASASTATLISGSAKRACSSITMMSVPSTISKPPPQAMPLTAEMIGLSRLRGWFRPPKPPAPQSASDSSPAAAPFRSQPAQKKRSPAPVTMATRSCGSSRNAPNTSFRRRLAGRSIALAFGRSMVTSRMGPSVTVLIPSDIALLLWQQPNQGIDSNRALAARSDDHRVHVEFDQAIDVGLGVASAGHRSGHQCRDIGLRPAAMAPDQPAERQLQQRLLDGHRRKRRQQADAVTQQFGQHAAGPEHQDMSELRVD